MIMDRETGVNPIKRDQLVPPKQRREVSAKGVPYTYSAIEQLYGTDYIYWSVITCEESTSPHF